MTALDARPARASAMTGLAVRPPSDGGGRTALWLPWLLVAAAVGWNLASLRALTLGVAYLNDSSLHEQMVRFATAQLRAGHMPLSSWFPFLGEGSPQFLHYQSLPALLTGALGLLTGPDVAFRWTLYLLLSLWPISVYLSARAFGAGRPAAAASAAMAPFLVSATGVGYEQHAYVWTGFGVWTQLWASWTLPLAWGFSWRAIRDGRGYLRAVLLTALTVALHFETGYLALSVLLVWPLLAGRPLVARLRRAAVILGGSLLASAWVIVPLVAQRQWAAVNEVFQGTPLANGYGARRVLDWLVSGQLLDHGRLPVVTVFAALGLGLAWLAWSSDVDGRALLVALAVCLLLAFGRTTFGSLVDLIPGSADLFFRRFTMGAQLAALLLAGRGAAWLAAGGVRLLEARVARWPPGLSPAAVLVGAIAVLAPAWLQLGAYDRHDGAAIAAQRRADDTEGAELDRLIAVIKRDGGGRTYAGMPSNWGQDFTVGAVPAFKYLESRDVDEVGYTLRTASLMTDPEYFFDDRDPSDYRLFGIRYLILPARDQPPVSARLAMRSGPYWLWTIDGAGYVQAGRIVGEISANRTNVGTRSVRLLHSGLAADGAYLSVRYGVRRWRGRPPTDGTKPVLRRRNQRATRRPRRRRGRSDAADAPSRNRGAQRLLRPRVEGNRERQAAADPDRGAGARRGRRPRGHRSRRVPLPRVRGLPGAARAERPRPRHDRRRGGVHAARGRAGVRDRVPARPAKEEKLAGHADTIVRADQALISGPAFARTCALVSGWSNPPDRRYRLLGQQADRRGVPGLDLNDRTGGGQIGGVRQRRTRAVVSAYSRVLEHIGQLQEARLVGDREDERRLLDRRASGGFDRLDQRGNVLLFMTGDQRREGLRLATQADRLGLVRVEVGLQILEREREVEDAHVSAPRRAQRAAHVGTDGAGAIYGTGGHRAAQDEAGPADALNLDGGQLGAGDVGGIHLSRSYL